MWRRPAATTGLAGSANYGWLPRFEADGLDGVEGPIPAASSLTAGHPSRQRGEDHLAAAAVRSIAWMLGVSSVRAMWSPASRTST
jgi:hypothetical protein